jgi:hypothetical protein
VAGIQTVESTWSQFALGSVVWTTRNSSDWVRPRTFKWSADYTFLTPWLSTQTSASCNDLATDCQSQIMMNSD